MSKLTVEEIREIVESITYKPQWNILLGDDGERLFVQIEATTLDSRTKEETTWKSGKTYLSPFMCRQEIVGAVFGTIEKAELHEMREFFRYRGVSIYNPHLDPDALAEVAKKKESFNFREDAMGMDETVEEKSRKNSRPLPDPYVEDFSFSNTAGESCIWRAPFSDNPYMGYFRIHGGANQWISASSAKELLFAGIWRVINE